MLKLQVTNISAIQQSHTAKIYVTMCSGFPLSWLQKFQDFFRTQKHFFKTPAMFKYRDEQQLQTIHNSMIAASKLVYTFITVTCNTRMYCME